MEVGQPSAPAPRAAREAARAALETGRIGYTEALGIVRPARADRPSLPGRLRRRRRAGADRRHDGLVGRLRAGVPEPFRSRTAHRHHGAGLSGLPQHPAKRSISSRSSFRSSKPEGWIMTAQAVETAHAEKPLHGILAMSPANPSGTMIGRDALRRTRRTCRRLGLWFISDEIYHGLTYSAPASTALSSDDDAVVINSFSKYYCMTGWRIGWMVVPERVVRPIERLAQNLYISPPYLSQVAALAAFDAIEELESGQGGLRPQPRAPAARNCRASASPTCIRSTAPSTSMPMSPASRTIPSPSAGACSTRRGSRRRPGWISTPSRARITCASRSPGRKTIVARRCPVSRHG